MLSLCLKFRLLTLLGWRLGRPLCFWVWTSELGLIAPGYRADLVAFNANFEVIETWIAGRSDSSTL